MYKKTNVLILISHFTPGTKMGGPLTSINNIINKLYLKINFNIITFDHDLKCKTKYNNIITGKWLLKDKYKIIYISKNIFKYINLLLLEKYDVIYINSFFHPTFSIIPIFLKKINLIQTNIIISPRGELFDAALNFKKYKKNLYLLFFKIFNLKNNLLWHVSSQLEKKAILEKLNIEENSIVVLNNFINNENNINYDIINKSPTSNYLNIIYLARISKDKNLEYVFKVLKNIKTLVNFDIYGPIEDNNIWNNCLALIKDLPDNIIINYKGVINNEHIHNVLVCYDLFFLPSLSENFGNSIAESLLCGTPVLISDKTPWLNLKSKQIGWDIPLENLPEFVNVIESFPKLNNNEKIKKKIFIRNQFLKIYFDDGQLENYFILFNQYNS